MRTRVSGQCSKTTGTRGWREVIERPTCERDSPSATMLAVASSSTERRMGPAEKWIRPRRVGPPHSTQAVQVSEPPQSLTDKHEHQIHTGAGLRRGPTEFTTMANLGCAGPVPDSRLGLQAPPATETQLKASLEEALKVNYELQLDKLAKEKLIQVNHLPPPLFMPYSPSFCREESSPAPSVGRCVRTCLVLVEQLMYLHRARNIIQPIAARGHRRRCTLGESEDLSLFGG